MQHILVYSAIPLGDSGEWKRNGAGFLYHDKFGFGILKASRLVHAAKVRSKSTKHGYLKPQIIIL